MLALLNALYRYFLKSIILGTTSPLVVSPAVV